MEVQTKTVIDQLTVIFRNVFNDETIFLTDKMTANDVSSWDSLSHMLMITEVENAFSIKFTLREINKLKNVGALIDLIQAKRTR